MGGYGHGYKTELDGLLWLDTAKLNEWNYFNGFRGGTLTWSNNRGDKSSIGITVDITEAAPFARLQYTSTDRWTEEKTDMDYKVPLTTTPCYFGGKRYWFICPLIKDGTRCGRRVRKLFMLSKYFGCRNCHDLCYSSQNENHKYAYSGLFKILEYERKAEELREEITVEYYNGKPTRKMKRYLELRQKAMGGYLAWEKIDDLLKM